MNLFVWTDTLATGNAFIDEDHRALIVRVNAVLGAIALQHPGDALQNAIHALVVYTREHFAREEAEMQRIHFNNTVLHSAEHVRLLEQLEAVRAQLAAGTPVEQMDLYRFLTWWVKDHIRQEDTELAAAMQA
jgi:hemerythrin-like metal-binding protein